MNPDSGESRNPRIGDKIRKRRQALGWEQKDLAARVGVHVNSVHKWEADISYPSRKLGKLEEVLGITLDSAPPSRTVLDEIFGEADAAEFRRRVRAVRGSNADWYLERVEDALNRPPEPREGGEGNGARQAPL